MAENDHWDHAGYRRRRRREYEDDYGDPPILRIAHSRAVTAIGITTIALGSLEALAGLSLTCLFLLGPDVLGPDVVIARDELALGVIRLVISIPFVLTGVGVLKRKKWARVVTLIFGVLTGLSALPAVASPFHDVGATAGAFVFSALVFVVYMSYGIFVFVVLRDPAYAEEFQ